MTEEEFFLWMKEWYVFPCLYNVKGPVKAVAWNLLKIAEDEYLVFYLGGGEISDFQLFFVYEDALEFLFHRIKEVRIRIKTIQKMLVAFEHAAIKHAEATQEGNARVGNRNYDKIVKSVSDLKSSNSLDELRIFLNHDNMGVRIWAALYLLPKYEKEASDVLEEISKKGIPIISFDAEMTLKEWRNGNLKDSLYKLWEL